MSLEKAERGQDWPRVNMQTSCAETCGGPSPPQMLARDEGVSGQVVTSWCRPWMSRMSRLVTDQWKVRPGTALPKEKGFWLLVIPVM